MLPLYLTQIKPLDAISTSVVQASEKTVSIRQAKALVTAVINKGLYEILLDNKKFRLSSRETWVAGQEIDVEIKDKNGSQLIIARTTPSNRTASNYKVLANPFESAQQQLIRQTLPHQRPVLPVLKHLYHIASESNTHQPAPAEQTAQRLKALFTNIKTPLELTQAKTLKQAFLNSGLFTETTLSQVNRSETSLHHDLKVQIQRLLSSLSEDTHHQPHTKADSKTNPPQATTKSIHTDLNPVYKNKSSTHVTDTNITQGVISKAEIKRSNKQALLQQLYQATEKPKSNENDDSSIVQDLKSWLSRIQLNQQQSMTNESHLSLWRTDIPMLNQDDVELLKLDIEKKHKQEQQKQIWNVQLELNLDDLGMIQANLSLHDVQISVSLWAENPMTQQLIRHYQDELTTLFHQAGLECDSVQCCDKPIHKPDTQTINCSLVDHLL